MIDLLATFIATFLMELGQALALRDNHVAEVDAKPRCIIGGKVLGGLA